MASIAFPRIAKRYRLSTSQVYGYAYHPRASPSLPTILFLHGFPSSCYDWRHQIQFFSSKGYGVLVPDLLGYGDTAKPIGLEHYKTKTMVAEIIEILDHEGLSRVHAVGHDTGCTLLSRLANYSSDRILSCTFLDVPYSKPAEHFDLNAVNTLTKQFLGYERFGYLDFFVKPNAGDILDRHSESFFTLFYPADPELWIKHVGPTGAMETWLLQDQRGPQPPYINDAELATHQIIMKNSHGSALNWYRALVSNLNEQDEIEADINAMISMPVLMISPQRSKLELPGLEEQMNQVVANVTFKRVSTKGHWLQLEAREEVNDILMGFFDNPKLLDRE